ncbi:MAG: hypothetical protein IPL40_07735 [Proteobacteria bacterium]|nr:hypothetical protein [Pseudomonadota bacterium]
MRDLLISAPRRRRFLLILGPSGLGAVLALGGVVGLGACATRARPLPVGSVLEQARQECARLRETTLPRPVQTPVDGSLAELDRLVATGQSAAAAERARTLSSTCNAEAEQRGGLLVLSVDVESLRSRLAPQRYAQFRWLAQHGDYGSAIICGQALLNGDRGGCEGAPSERATLAAAASKPGAVAPTSPGGAALSQDWDATEGDDDATTSGPASASVGGAAGTLRDRMDRAPSHRAPSRTAAWVAFGAGGAALATGGVLALLATQRRAELADRCPDCSRAELEGGKRLALGADLAFGVGLTAAITGLVLWLANPSATASRGPGAPAQASGAGRGSARGAQVSVTTRGVGARWAF